MPEDCGYFGRRLTLACISVIVPVYKVEAYIHRCVDSILEQSFQDFELILVDDGSPDNCGAICDEYGQKDSRIHVIHQENGGLSAARNAGIDWVFAHSDSQWLTFVDSDDWIHGDYLRILLEAAQTHGAGIAACGYTHVRALCEDAPADSCTIFSLESENAYVNHYGMCITACCKLYRKELLSNVRFPVGKLHEDCYTTHIPLFAAGRVAVCDVPLYYYYTNPGSITRARWKPKRLEEIDAHEQRLAWLREHGYAAAAKRELDVYADTLLEQAEILLELRKVDQSCTPYLNQLRQKLRHTLQLEKTVGKLDLDQGSLWAMLMAYGPGSAYGLLRKVQKMKNTNE